MREAPKGLCALLPKTFILTGPFAPVCVRYHRENSNWRSPQVGKGWKSSVGWAATTFARVWIRFKNSLAQLSGANALPALPQFTIVGANYVPRWYIHKSSIAELEYCFLIWFPAFEIYSRARESSCLCVCLREVFFISWWIYSINAFDSI